MLISIVCSEYNCTSRRFTFQIIQFHNLSPIIGLETNNFKHFRIKTQTDESETIKVHHLKIYLLVKREQCVFSGNMQLHANTFSLRNWKQLSSRCSKNKKWKNNKINSKYWSIYIQWINLLLLTTNLVDKIVGKTSFYLHNLLRY